jgi:8-oxo-dGTP pyrophosphatase MutT (NUDIX family)|tara:strand:- start:368 stop:949 length:582 start_codon:yes stop_codon:yes gene_type:complete
VIASNLTLSQLEHALRSHPRVNDNDLSSLAPAAVAVLFNITKGEPCLLMIKRAGTLRHHSGEWAFPGGLIESFDESPMHAALRETDEEIGVESKHIDIWCGLAPVETSTGFEVWPYVGRLLDSAALIPSKAEVADLVKVPVRVLADENSKRTIRLIRNGSTRNMTAYAYEDRIIWGASARIISNTIDIVTKSA